MITTATESPKGIIWDLDGAQLLPWQAADRLYKAGFEDPLLLGEACAVMKAESGWFLKAWHINAAYDDDGMLVLDGEGRFTAKSVDLGFIQRNVPLQVGVKLEKDAAIVGEFIDELFTKNPKLASGAESAKIAVELYKQRGWQPWYAHTNGYHRQYFRDAALAVGNMLGMRFGQGPIALQKTPRQGVVTVSDPDADD